MSYVDPKTAQKSYRPAAGTMSPGLKRAREPYRIKNAIVGLGLGAFAAGVWAYSISAVKQDVFDDVDEEARALGAGSPSSSSSSSAPSSTASSSSAAASSSTVTTTSPTRGFTNTTIGAASTPALPSTAGITQGTANLVLPGGDLPLPPVEKGGAAPVKPRGVLQVLDRRWPGRVLDPESKTLVWGAPDVDRLGKVGEGRS